MEMDDVAQWMTHRLRADGFQKRTHMAVLDFVFRHYDATVRHDHRFGLFRVRYRDDEMVCSRLRDRLKFAEFAALLRAVVVVLDHPRVW